MKARLSLMVVAVLLLMPLGALAAPKRLVLLFTGDNRGEIAPCGCKAEPQGGLARRKTAIDAERAGEQGLGDDLVGSDLVACFDEDVAFDGETSNPTHRDVAADRADRARAARGRS